VRWKPRRGDNRDVIDVRGGSGGLPVRAGGSVGIVGVVIFLAIQLLGGGSNFDIPTGFDGGTSSAQGEPIPASQDPDRKLRQFSAFVFTDVQDSWERTFAAQGRKYRRAKLVLYSGQTGTGCGTGSTAQGPFYCPADERVYLDLSFYSEMESQLRAGGDFAWAYVIGHELGHHVQKLVGTSDKVDQLRADDPSQGNALSVRLELQADCYSGVWARSVFDQLEDGDVEEAMTASQAVGDDRLQKAAGRRVNPDSFTHGSSAQRLKWFKAGQAQGEPADCDTFSGDI
jgi:predicted metalloprotease